MKKAVFAVVLSLLLVGAFLPAGASTAPTRQISHGSMVGADDGAAKNHFGHQHGPSTGHLEGSSENVELVGKLKLTNQRDEVSDVSALQSTETGKWYAYVGNWAGQCGSGGIDVADISDPANPVKVGFLNSPGFGYKTEGIQALRIDTAAYTGDILVTSNEWCKASGNPKNMPGGISIHEIDNPEDGSKALVEAFGDFDVHGNRANESHSAIAWDAGDRAYVAAIDNEEILDVDLFDITNPGKPVLLSETNLPGVNVNAYGNEKGSHDMDVLQFPNGEWHLMVSDWDAGWIDVNVTNPSNPVVVGDFDYAECDQVVEQELGKCLQPEGNAHQGEWSSDGSLFVGTDEDFSPFRLPIQVTDGPLAGQEFPAGEFSFTKQVASFPGGKINGPMVFGGYGCPDDAVPPVSTLGTLASDEEAMIVFERGPVGDPNHDHHGACFFSDKIRSGEDAGYDVVLVANHHSGAQAGDFPDAFICGSQGSPVLGTAAGLCVGHRFMHLAFGRAEDYTVPYPSGDPGDLEPNPGDLGPRIEAASEFDGVGYTRILDTSDPANPTEVGQFTIPETMDQSFASGFGDLSVHEVEVPRGDANEGGTAPDDDLVAYFSWYSGGIRVMDLTDPTGQTELGHYIDPQGSNFWGVALAEDQNGDRIILGSDMDYGLFIFRYTGELPTP